jgi:uncharacterized membrane protein
MTPRGLTIALLASAAVNVFLVGAAVGLVAVRGFAPEGPAAAPANPLRAAAERLDPDNRDAMLALLQDETQANGPVLLDARRARREASRLMMVQPFDKAATLAALNRARADDIQVRTQIEEAVVDFAAKLSPQQRAALSTGLIRPPAPKPPRAGLLGRLGLAPPPGPR